jgi:3-oxoacyl-[acyl-carrier protein] reductase
MKWPGIEGKLALVTGGTRGIGREVAAQLADSGARVIVTGRSQESAQAAAEELCAAHGVEVRGIGLDLSNLAASEATLDALGKELKPAGGVQLVVLNAGMTRDGLVMRMPLTDWQAVIDANLSGAFLVTRSVVPSMIRSRYGRIVAISSVVGRIGNPGQANYSASKSGLIGLVKALARELASREITVNAIAPGFIDTDMTRTLNEEQREKLKQLIPLARLGQARDVASAVMFLLSDAAAYITGEVIDVNGGMEM